MDFAEDYITCMECGYDFAEDEMFGISVDDDGEGVCLDCGPE